MEKPCIKCTLKARPRLPFNFGKYPRIAIACKNFFEREDISKEDYQKAFKS